VPTYSYRCTACDNRFDIFQSFTDDTLTTCTECGAHLRKVFDSIGVTFNGSGFYRTDSRVSAATPTDLKKSPSGSNDVSKTSTESAKTSPTARPSTPATTN
jgi:putative FmdB family regulatory protein